MSAAQTIKDKGLPTLKYVADRVNKPHQTLRNWLKANPELFHAVADGIQAQDEKKRT